jgi:DNA modification methylase
MTIETWPLERIVPYAKNARKIPQRAIDKVATSLREFGWQQPIVVDTAGVIIVGHTRLLAARQLGWLEAPVHIADKLTPAQIAAYRLMDNRSHEESSWNMDILGPELLDLQAMKFDLSMTGFELRELGKLIPASHEEPEAQMDRAEELQGKWNVARGEIWEIGEHRLMCGDSTTSDVRLLMDGKTAALLATDPPYGVGYGVDSGPDSAKRFTAMTGDGATGEELQRFLEAAFVAAMPHLNEDAAWYLWHAQMTQGFFAAAAAAAQLLIHRQIIWAKSHFILGHGDYHWQHELCFYGWRSGHRAPWHGGRDQSTVWEVDNPRAADAHATGKPAELFARPMRNHTVAGEICLELFAGSGAQFVAAQNLNRRCYGMEIEPKYCAVILERMTAMGLRPVRLQSIKEPDASRRPEQVPAI